MQLQHVFAMFYVNISSLSLATPKGKGAQRI
jgi:hypothetical protein